MEPRILYSADIAGGLLLANGQTALAEQRTLDASGEYAASPVSASVAQLTPASAVAPDAPTIAVAYAATALHFETNVGQASETVDFVAQGSGYDISLSGGSVELRLARWGANANVQLGFDGGNSNRPAEAQDLLAAQSHYLVGNDSAAWRTGIANYGSVVYRDVYDGVDIRYYGTQRQLEYDFLVAPGANADQIRLRFTGAQTSLDTNGDLILTLDGLAETLRFKAPVSFQDGPLGRQAVDSSYQLHADGSVGFALGEYDHTQLLVIDPVLSYASYFGGTGNETALGVAVDSAGSVYITGRTTSALGSLVGAGGSGDVYVAKFSADLTTLIYSTRIGGTGDEQGNSIAVDGSGNASVTGWTQSANFPTLAAAQAAMSGSQDAFVFRLNAAGSGLAFSTFLGGLSATDQGAGIAVDTSGNVYATGQRSQAAVAVATGLGGSTLTGDEAFVVKYDAAGAVQYSQFFGGTGADAGVAIAVDTSGNAYIVGQSSSSNLPMVNSHDTSEQNDEGFIAKINAAGNSLLYSSFIGGNKMDFVTAVAVDASGKAYVTGQTEGKNNTQFQVTAGAFQTINSGIKESGFLRVYDTGLSGAASLLYSTFLGGVTGTGPNNGDRPTGIGIDASGRAVVVGRTDTSDFPVTADAYSSTNTSSGTDGATFLVVLNPAGGGSGDLIYGTFVSSASSAGSLALSGGKAVFAAATSTNGLSTTGVAQPSRAGGTDAIVVSFNVTPNAAPVIAGANALTAVLEDPALNPGTLVSALIAGQVTDANAGALAGIAVTGVVSTNGAWEYSLNNGTSWNAFGAPTSAAATLLASDAMTRVRFVPNSNFAGTVSGGFSFRAWDRTGGTAVGTASTTSNGGATAFSSAIASASITVTSVNDAPVRTAGTFSDLQTTTSAPTSSLNLGGLTYGTGGGSDEAAQTLSYRVTTVPAAALGNVVLVDGTTVVTANTNYSLADLQGMKFTPTAVSGTATFAWTVQDNGGTANGGVDSRSESLQISVTVGPNSAPVLTGSGNFSSILEDSTGGTGTLVSSLTAGNVSDADSSALVGIAVTAIDSSQGSWQFSRDSGLSWSAMVAPSASSSLLLAADTSTYVRLVPAANFAGTLTSALTFRAWDRTSGTAGTTADTTSNGGTTAFSTATASASITVTSVNDAPVRTAGTVTNLTVAEDAAVTSLGLGGLAYSVGGGSDESAQTLSYSVTAVPAASQGHIVLANGTTVVNAASSYSLAQLQGMQFRAAEDANGGPATFSWSVTDSGGTTNGGINTLAQSLTITVTSVNDAPVRTAGTVANLSVAENATTTSLGLGSLAYAVGGGSDESVQTLSYSVTALPAASLGDIVLANGSTVVSAAGSYSLAQLQGMQFRAAANANGGPATFSWSATDSGGVANGGVNTLAQSLTVTVRAAPIVVSTPIPTPTPAPVTDPISEAQVVVQQTAPSSPVDNPVATAAVTAGGQVALAQISLAAGTGETSGQADDGGGGGDANPGFVSRSAGGSSVASVAQIAQASVGSIERRAAIPAPQAVAEPEFALFNLQAGGATLSLQETERTLRSPVFLEQIDRMREDLRKELNLDRTVAISIGGATLGVSVIYLLWLIRGGVLIGSYLSALPAWQVLDPLPILEKLKDPTQDGDDLPDDLSDDMDDRVQSLRGY